MQESEKPFTAQLAVDAYEISPAKICRLAGLNGFLPAKSFRLHAALKDIVPALVYDDVLMPVQPYPASMPGQRQLTVRPNVLRDYDCVFHTSKFVSNVSRSMTVNMRWPSI